MIVTFIDGSPAAERLLDAARRRTNRRGRCAAKPSGSPTRSIVAAVQGADVESVHEMASKSYAVARNAGDPTVTVATIQGLLRAEYMLGNLRAVDELFPVLERASPNPHSCRSAPSGCRSAGRRTRSRAASSTCVQQLIDATMREGTRYRTFNTEIAATMQQLLLLFERDEIDLLADLVRPARQGSGPGVWHAVLGCANRTTTGSR